MAVVNTVNNVTSLLLFQTDTHMNLSAAFSLNSLAPGLLVVYQNVLSIKEHAQRLNCIIGYRDGRCGSSSGEGVVSQCQDGEFLSLLIPMVLDLADINGYYDGKVEMIFDIGRGCDSGNITDNEDYDRYMVIQCGLISSPLFRLGARMML